MKKQFFSLLLAFGLFSFSACNKDEAPTPKTRTELITTATWKFGAATVGGTDVSSQLQACQKDNVMTFVSDGSGTLDEGLTKCNSGDPQSTSITWNFATNETVLHINTVLFAGGSNDFNIVALNESQLVLSQTITVGGVPQNVVVTFLH